MNTTSYIYFNNGNRVGPTFHVRIENGAVVATSTAF